MDHVMPGFPWLTQNNTVMRINMILMKLLLNMCDCIMKILKCMLNCLLDSVSNQCVLWNIVSRGLVFDFQEKQNGCLVNVNIRQEENKHICTLHVYHKNNRQLHNQVGSRFAL